MLDYEVLQFGFCTLVRDNLPPTENRWFSAPSGMRLFSMTVVVLNEGIVALCDKEFLFFSRAVWISLRLVSSHFLCMK